MSFGLFLPSSWSVSGTLFERAGAASRNDLAAECFLLVFSPIPEMIMQSTQGRGAGRTRWSVGAGGECVLWILWKGFMHTFIIEREDFVIDPSRD